MRAFQARLCLAALLAAGTLPAAFAAGNTPGGPPLRVEARSANLLAVGIVHDDQMSIHLSRFIDNAPVRDAALTVLLRGVLHPTTAEADGSYTLRTSDLTLPGPASVVFQVVRGEAREDLGGTLGSAPAEPKPEDKNGARQLWWWVLNIAVCTGFLLLISRRRKAAAGD